jgi:hypothetical protein
VSLCYGPSALPKPLHLFLLSHHQAQRFERGARKLKRQMWWQDKRWYIVFFIIVVIIILIGLKAGKVI